MASVQTTPDTGGSQLPGGMTREQAQHIYKVCTIARSLCAACDCTCVP